MSNFLRDLANAHKIIEGFYPPGTPGFPKGSVSWRNLNPGNLRYRSHQRIYGAEPGYMNFAKFPTYEKGFQALMDDLRAKITGHSAHIDYRRNPSFLTYVRVYAPADDGNDPAGYTQKLIRMLGNYNLKSSTPLSELARLIVEPDVPPEPKFINTAVAIRGLKRLIESTTNLVRKQRLLERLKNFMA